MPRSRRMLAPINSIKHYVHRAEVLIAIGGILNHTVVDAVIAPATAAPGEVIQGAVIKAVFIEFWLSGDAISGTNSQFNLTVEKKRDLEPDMTFAQSANLGGYPNKKNILYTTQGIVPSVQGGAGSTTPVLRSWISIPKGKQRFGLDDQLMVNISAVQALQVCGIAIYKEYR